MNRPGVSLLRVILISGAVALGLYLFWLNLIQPEWRDLEKIAQVEKQIVDRQAQMRKVQAELAQLERWRKLSLPPDPHQARLDYDRYLNDLLQQAGWQVEFLTPDKVVEEKKEQSPAVRGKAEPAFTPLTYQLRARANLTELTRLLDRFQHTPLLHRFKSLRLQRADPNNVSDPKAPLLINATVEALVVHGVQPRPGSLYSIDERLLRWDVLTALRRGPAGLALVPWAVAPNGPLGPTLLAPAGVARQYGDLARKNIFIGFNPPPPPALSIADIKVKEGNNSVTDAKLTVTLSRSSTSPITVEYLTKEGTAKAESDFKPAHGTIVFKPGETKKTITVLVIGDTEFEPDEDFYVELTEPTGATISRGKAKVTIQNDDPDPDKVVVEPQPEGPDMTQFVYLTFINQTVIREEAFLRNRATNRMTRLRSTAGYNIFRITDESGDKVQLQAKVLRIESRDVYFQVDDEIFRLHIGQSVAEALRRPLRESEIKALGLLAGSK